MASIEVIGSWTSFGSRTAARMSARSIVPSSAHGISRMEAPAITAWPAPSLLNVWMAAGPMISPPRGTWAMSPTRLPIVPLATSSPASAPSSSADRSSSALTVGSSPKTSSPTSASAIARRMAGEGSVTVSDRRSIMPSRLVLVVEAA